MKYFQNIENLNDLKKAYHKLAKLYHSDIGGSDEIMKVINAEHDELFEILKHKQNTEAKTDNSKHETTETPEEFRAIVLELLKLEGLYIELCGCWLWISGETKQHKETLKALGCNWCKNKKMWSWHHAEETKSYYRSRKSIEEIRGKYGSERITNANDTARLK